MPSPFLPPISAKPKAALPNGWFAALSGSHMYYYSVVTQRSQWERPTIDAAVAAGWRLLRLPGEEVHGSGSAWYYYDPNTGGFTWYPQMPELPAMPERPAPSVGINMAASSSSFAAQAAVVTAAAVATLNSSMSVTAAVGAVAPRSPSRSSASSVSSFCTPGAAAAASARTSASSQGFSCVDCCRSAGGACSGFLRGGVCRCRALWTAPSAHSQNAPKERWDDDPHGEGCRCVTCWAILVQLCDAGTFDCEGRRLAVAHAIGGDAYRHAIRTNGPLPCAHKGRHGRHARLCRSCGQATYVGRNFCENPSCSCKGGVRLRRCHACHQNTFVGQNQCKNPACHRKG